MDRQRFNFCYKFHDMKQCEEMKFIIFPAWAREQQKNQEFANIERTRLPHLNFMQWSKAFKIVIR